MMLSVDKYIYLVRLLIFFLGAKASFANYPAWEKLSSGTVRDRLKWQAAV
jgi:hypothetical protein